MDVLSHIISIHMRVYRTGNSLSMNNYILSTHLSEGTTDNKITKTSFFQYTIIKNYFNQIFWRSTSILSNTKILELIRFGRADLMSEWTCNNATAYVRARYGALLAVSRDACPTFTRVKVIFICFSQYSTDLPMAHHSEFHENLTARFSEYIMHYISFSRVHVIGVRMAEFLTRYISTSKAW